MVARAFLISHITLLCFAAETIVDNNSHLFLSWFSSNGGKSINVSIREFPDMGRGVVATSNLAENDNILFAPNHLQITKELVSKTSGANFAKLLQSDEEVIIAYLLHEKSKGQESFWAPYIRVLPSYVPTVIYFSPYEINEFQNPTLIRNIIGLQEEVESQYKDFLTKCSSIWTQGNITDISFADYQWASSIVSSRGLRFHGRIHLVPFADMFNYDPHPVRRSSSSGDFFLKHHQLQSNGDLIISSDRNCVTDDQLFEDYGDNTNEIYMQFHGFVPKNNPFACILLSGQLIGSLPPNTQKLMTALQFKQSPKKCVPTSGEFGRGLDSFLILQSLNDSEIRSCLDAVSSSKKLGLGWPAVFRDCRIDEALEYLNARRNESVRHEDLLTTENDFLARVLSSVQRWLVSSAPSYKTSIQQDEEVLLQLQNDLQQSSFQPQHAENEREEAMRHKLHLSLAVAYRLQEKQLWSRICKLYGTTCPIVGGKQTNLPEMVEPDAVVEKVEISPDVYGDTNTAVNSAERGVSLQDKIDQFQKWYNLAVKSNDVSVHTSYGNKLSLREIPGFRLGTVATSAIEAEEIYVSVPDEIIVDAEKAIADPLVGPFLRKLAKKYGRRDEFHEIIFFILHEMYVRGESSAFWPYLQLLPTYEEMDIPLTWTTEERYSRLTPSQLANDTEKYARRIDTFYTSILKEKIITDFFDASSSNTVFTLQRYKWATAILDSRSIWWNGTRHLVPMLDMINCAEGPEKTRVHSTQMENSMAITRAGE